MKQYIRTMTSIFACRSAACVIALFLFVTGCSPAWASTVVPNIPTVKAWCCTGSEFGVFDLTGNWQGVNPHAPTPSPFLGPNFFYEDTGSSGQSFLNITLASQQLFPPVETGGQQVIQTYTGTLIQTWYESPNNTGGCLPIPQISRNMCEYVRRTASYDVEFALRWCKSFDGFALHGLVSTDMDLIFTDSGLPIPERMAIYPVPGEFCPTVDITSSAITYDREGTMLAAISPGGQVYFGAGTPNPYDELIFTFGEREGCWCEAGGNNLPTFTLMKRIGSVDIADLRGSIHFSVSSDLPLDLVEMPFQPSGQFNLLRQSGVVRNRMPLETDEDWNSYLESIKEVFSFQDAKPVFDFGLFRFDNLPLFDVLKVGTRNVVRPARYSLQIRGLNVEEYVTGSNPLVTQFTKFSNADAFSIQTGETIPMTVTPLDNIPIKRNIIDQLSLMSPTRYIGPENLALAHVNDLESNGPSPPQLEGLKRAILAERVIRDGGRFAEQQIKSMLDGLNIVLSSIIDEVLDRKGTAKELKDKKKVLDKLKGELKPQDLTNDGWGSVPVDKDAIHSSIKHLLDQNADLRYSVAAKQIKSWVGTMLSQLKYGLVAGGLSEESAAVVSKVVSGVINTVLDIFIEQGIGASRTLAKEALKAAVSSAQDDLFETLPGSYTYWTVDAASYSQQQLSTWDTDNDPQFRTDRSLAEGELVQMGIDAYGNLGIANALNITSAGFADAGSKVGPVSSLPVFKHVKVIAKLGKYLTGAASFVVPLKGAFWDTPERVMAGVAKSYGQVPGNIFPLPPGAEAGGLVLPNGLGNAVVNPLKATLNQIRSMSNSLKTAWNNNSVGSLLDLAADSDPGDLTGLINKYEQELADLLAVGAAFQGDSITAVQMQSSFVSASIGFREALADLSSQHLNFLVRILQREYSGPADPVYLADKAQIINQLDAVNGTANALRFIADEYRSVMLSQPFRAAVAVNDVLLVSDSTAGALVTQASEVFTISARIRNLGAIGVTGVEAELTLPVGASATIQSTATQVVGSGSLAANDNLTGTGPDEAVVSWQVQYTGPLDEEVKIPLKIQSRSTTVDDPGNYGDTYVVLDVDPEVLDPDGDGMPTAWENDNGLDPGVDDGDNDDDVDDLTNAEEYEHGTLAQIADSDVDGRDDGDEVAGLNGWVTDPADNDTDDDGVLDGADGSPLDPTTADPSNNIEPVVSVSSHLVVLDADVQQAHIDISNAGTGTLIWTVESQNNALVIAGSPGQSVYTGGLLTVQLTPGLDIQASIGTLVQVKVGDIAGAVADEQIINVYIGDPPDPPNLIFGDGFESP